MKRAHFEEKIFSWQDNIFLTTEYTDVIVTRQKNGVHSSLGHDCAKSSKK